MNDPFGFDEFGIPPTMNKQQFQQNKLDFMRSITNKLKNEMEEKNKKVDLSFARLKRVEDYMNDLPMPFTSESRGMELSRNPTMSFTDIVPAPPMLQNIYNEKKQNYMKDVAEYNRVKDAYMKQKAILEKMAQPPMQ